MSWLPIWRKQTILRKQAGAEAEDGAPAAAPWKLSVTPYIWATSLDGKAGVAGKEADVDVSFSDLLKYLNVAAMLDLELRKGGFALMSDTVYANLEDNSSRLHGGGSRWRPREGDAALHLEHGR